MKRSTYAQNSYFLRRNCAHTRLPMIIDILHASKSCRNLLFVGEFEMKNAVLAMALFLICGAVLASDAPGVVSHILVLSDKSEDVSSPEAWKKTYIKDGMTDQEKAQAVWRTVVKYRHQTAPPNEWFCAENVHDPIKTINVYGYGMCCCASSNIEGLSRFL